MAQHEPAPPGDGQPFTQRIESLAAAFEELPRPVVETGPQTRKNRHVYWLIGSLCALTIGVAEVVVLARSDQVDVPTPPPAVLAAYQNDPCATRMAAIMNAISAYTSQLGSPPPSLAALYPAYLNFTPVDPVSKQPYGYEVMGSSVSLSCPSGSSAAASAGGPSGA